MIGDLLPTSFDDSYHGQKLALWLLGFVALSKIVMGLNCIFNGHYVASVADGIPLDSFTPAGAQAVVTMFAAWGLSVLVLGGLSMLALVRYRGMVPFMLAVLVLEHVCRRLIFVVLPIARTGGSRGWLVNLVLLAVMLVGLVLSVWRRPGTATGAQEPVARTLRLRLALASRGAEGGLTWRRSYRAACRMSRSSRTS